MHLLYSLGVVLLLIVGLPFWLLQMARTGKYRTGLAERFGKIPRRLRATARNENCIWVHAVSVGEVLASAGLIAGFKKKFPDWRVVVSTTTLTGQTLARQKFGEANVFYFPVDLKTFVRPYFRHLRPRALMLAESEFWPNQLAIAKESGCRVAVVNARISDRSFPRYRRFAGLLRKHVFSAIDLVLAQSQLDADRLVGIGADRSRVQVSGNVKFDFVPPPDNELVRQLRAQDLENVIVCGSTVAGEEQLLAPAFKQLLTQGATIILAPRHPERFDEVASLLTNAGVSVVRRSRWAGEALPPGTLFLLDTIGELAAVYAVADVAFVGGSVVPRGGHNILEPAYFSKPILVGQHMENFRDVAQRFEEQRALITVSAEDFANTAQAILKDSIRRRELGARARQVFDGNAGATERTVSALEVLLWMPESLRTQMARGER
jgi:3-deoxy-D-manno-octulosonic-acid transferase